MSVRRRGAIAVVVLLLFAAGCSSSNEEATDTTNTDVTQTAAPGAKTTKPGASAAPGGPTTSVAEPSLAPAGVTPAPLVQGGGPLVLGRGVTRTTIKIGFNFSAPLGPAFQVVGFSGEPEGDNNERNIIDALVKYMNAHGGIAGRKIIPVYNEYEAANSQSWDALAEEACQRFIADEKVFAITTGHVGFTDALAACAAKGKTPILVQQQWPFDAKYFNEFAPYLYQPGRMRPERWAPAYISGLKAAGYFTPGYRLGLLRYDEPVFVRIAAMIKNALKKEGLTLTREEVIGTPHSVGDFGQMTSEISAATLRFKSSEITHVIFDEWAGQMPYFGLTVADQQDFHPRYGFTSVQLTNTQAQQHSDSGQLEGALGVSWLPGQDVAKADDPRKGGEFGRCLKIFSDAGVAPNRLYDGTWCDNLFFLDRALSTTNNLTAAGLNASTAKLGTSYDSPYTWATKFGPGRPDGASAYRIEKFVPSCGCFRYTSPNRPAG